jgi:hypothetical protein
VKTLQQIFPYQNEVGKAIYQKLHSNVKINSSYSERKQMKMQLCMITQLKNERFFPNARKKQENVNRMHPVVENVFIINYVAFFF